MSRRVTAISACRQCGRPFEANRSDAVYCSNACRQKAHRGRHAVIRNGAERVRLTFELRERLRREISRRRLLALAAEDEALRIRDAELGREDVAAVRLVHGDTLAASASRRVAP